MNQPALQQTPPVYKGDMSEQLQRSSRKRWAIIAAVALAVILAFTAYYVLVIRKNQAQSAKETRAKVAQSAEVSAIKGNYTEAEQKLISYMNSGISNENKYLAMGQLASVYINEKKYDEALKWYDAADKLKGEVTIATVLGRAHTFERQGNKKLAAQYYRQAAEMIQKASGNHGYPGDVEHYQQLAKKLEEAQ